MIDKRGRRILPCTDEIAAFMENLDRTDMKNVMAFVVEMHASPLTLREYVEQWMSSTTIAATPETLFA
jgi:hypothetical protein